jgi:hypothetical protein
LTDLCRSKFCVDSVFDSHQVSGLPWTIQPE